MSLRRINALRFYFSYCCQFDYVLKKIKISCTSTLKTFDLEDMEINEINKINEI